MKAAIVVPTIRENNVIHFLESWQSEFDNHTVIVIEDNPERSFDISRPNLKHFSWTEIDNEFGSDSWIIPRRTDCVRSFGYYQAWQDGVDMIVTLDDDCFPAQEGFLQKHHDNINNQSLAEAWVSTGDGILPRGMPYEHRVRRVDCMISHGLWTNVPDLDAITQLANIRLRNEFHPRDQVIPKGFYFPMCGMNLAFNPLATPAMYFLLMGRDWPYDRFGDIWCGIFIKKICDHLGFGIRSGEPIVEHQRASNPWWNLRKELPGYELNEELWQAVDSVVLTRTTFKECYIELASKLPLDDEYWDRAKKAMTIWADLFAEK